jgi:DNA-binding LytR/AlgR family response regulator
VKTPLAPTALIADDERLMREQLRQTLALAWPDLQIVGEARNGLEALEMVQQLQPDLAFLDIRMPGMNGIEVAQALLSHAAEGGPCAPALVFVTAYDQYAIEAFEQGAVDYVLKPAQAERLARTAERLTRLRAMPAATPAQTSLEAATLQSLLGPLARHLGRSEGRYLQRIQASQGQILRLIPVGDILFFHSDEKYTSVRTADLEYLIRKPIKELVAELDPQKFWQIHRSTLVNAQAIDHVVRDDRGVLWLTLRGCPQKLSVSRSHAGLFKGM